MTRREWKAAVAAVVLWAGSAVASTPSYHPGSTANTENVVTIRTAGQPDRKLQVLKTERLPDGKYLTEVKDLGTGAIFTIADTKPLSSAESGTPQPSASPAAPATHPALLAGSALTPTNLPQARPRNLDPLLANSPASMAGASKSNPAPAPQPEYPTLIGKLRKSNPSPAAPPATVTPPPMSPSKQSPVSVALFGAHGTPPQPQPTLVGRFSAPSNANPVSQTPVNQTAQQSIQQPMPTLMGKLFGDRPAPAVAPPVTASKPPASVIRPNAVPVMEPIRTVALQPVATPVTETVATTMPKPVIEQVSLTPEKDPYEPNFAIVPVKAMTMQQIGELVNDLRMHHKPSQRVQAAIALSTSPMAGMVEVRQILAEASYRDPEPVVRAHCIDLLTKMQYDEPNYRKYVEGLVNDDEPAVRRAANSAMKR